MLNKKSVALATKMNKQFMIAHNYNDNNKKSTWTWTTSCIYNNYERS